MAMSMHPRNDVPGIDNPRSLGWRTWCALLGLVEHLGADLSEASLVNEGSPVSAQTARDWADRLRPVIGRAVLKNYEGMFEWEVDGVAVPSWPIPEWYLGIMWLLGLSDKRTVEPVEPPDPQDDARFLKELVRFFSECGGFAQA